MCGMLPRVKQRGKKSMGLTTSAPPKCPFITFFRRVAAQQSPDPVFATECQVLQKDRQLIQSKQYEQGLAFPVLAIKR